MLNDPIREEEFIASLQSLVINNQYFEQINYGHIVLLATLRHTLFYLIFYQNKQLSSREQISNFCANNIYFELVVMVHKLFITKEVKASLQAV